MFDVQLSILQNNVVSNREVNGKFDTEEKKKNIPENAHIIEQNNETDGYKIKERRKKKKEL